MISRCNNRDKHVGCAHCTSSLHWTRELQTSTILHSSCSADLQQTLLVIKPRREKGIAMLHLAKGLHLFQATHPNFYLYRTKLPCFFPIQPKWPHQRILFPSKCPLCSRSTRQGAAFQPHCTRGVQHLQTPPAHSCSLPR